MVAASWEWKADSGSFEAFKPDFQAKVEAAFVEAGGEGQVTVTHWDTKYNFNFDKMTQTNLDSNKTRDIQRIGPALASKPHPAATIEWQWKDGSKWATYAADIGARIEKGYLDAKTVDLPLEFGGNKYNVDFSKFVQVNVATNKVREVRRLVDGSATTTKKKREDDDDAGADALKSKAAKPDYSSGGPVDTSKVKVLSGGSPFHGTMGPMKLIKKGRGVVDPLSHMQESCHVYECGDVVYQCMLNQTNVDANNNKFYVIQLLESDKGSEYYVFTRWGRVGVPGQTSVDKMGSLPGAIAQYCKKFRDKTSNDWNALPTFHKVPGKYQLMDIDFGAEMKKPAAGLETAAAAGVPPSTLPVEVQNLMRMIGNTSDMVKSMKELEIDTNKMPLGKISKKQIKEAFGYLNSIDAELKKKSPSMSTIEGNTSMFYTLIPHDFGMSKPPVIRDSETLKRKMELLEVLSDIEIATKIISETKAGANPIDSCYKKLNCEIKPLSKASETFKRVEDYVRNTHGKTHTAYKLSVVDVFEVNREGEDARFNEVGAKISNRCMLWHGSRTTNFMGILSQGLRIAPPEAPVTGYMFGKAVYLADVSSKSANYCHASTSNPEGILLLVEASLGKSLELTAAKYMDAPPKGFNSTTGLGKMRPDPAGSQVVDGVEWPMGKMIDSGVTSTALLYPEYMVYNTAQQRMRYAVRVKFHFGK